MSARRDRAGFTLIELLVAMLVGLIVVMLVYSLGSSSSQLLAEQRGLSTLQTSARLAMEQIRADVERAGLYGSPNSDAERTCASPAFHVQAVEFTEDAFTGAIPNAADHGVHADRLRLTGNYVTSGLYEAQQIDGNTLKLNEDLQAFRHDFVDPSPGRTSTTISTTALARAFPAGTMLHVTNVDGYHFFDFLNSSMVVGGDARLVLQNGTAANGPCSLGNLATVAPLQRIEYAIVDPQLDASLSGIFALRPGETSAQRAAVDGIPSVLVRRRIDANGNVVPGTTRVVLENAVEFDLEFDVDTTSGPGTPPTIQRATSAQTTTAFGVGGGSRPQIVRAIRVQIATRSGAADPKWMWGGRIPGALTHYHARNTPLSARTPTSHVRRLSSTIFVPNVAYADLP